MLLPLLLKYSKGIPRYTSYPPAPFWENMSPECYHEHLHQLEDLPLSLYFHIPFCQSMCLFCGCSVILNRKFENELRYVDYLLKEITLVSACLGKRAQVTQLHLGGGTPTKLTTALLTVLMEKIGATFMLSAGAEVAIEVDPRTVYADGGEKLSQLKRLGFNRISFGVQDVDPQVQEAIKRRQSWEMTETTFNYAKKLGFEGINLDLIYGLPGQTPESFARTVEAILTLRPDRLALFSFAHVPHLKPHQKALPPLPSLETKFTLYTQARERLVEAGYVTIGMDHFALPHDELAHSYRQKTLQRNFQGYTVTRAAHLLGLGVTSIGALPGAYFQNVKKLEDYYALLDGNTLPVARGKHLKEEDLLRKWVIHQLMCVFALDKHVFAAKFNLDFDTHFFFTFNELQEFEREGFVINSKDRLQVTELGELFIRNIVHIFDAYQVKTHATFSSAI